MTLIVRVDQVFDALPERKEPIQFADLCTKIGPPDGAGVVTSVRKMLELLRDRGLASSEPGLGWYRVDVPQPRVSG